MSIRTLKEFLPEKCRNCEGTTLKWSIDVINVVGCQDGRIRMSEVSAVVGIYCEDCSEHLRQIASDVFVRTLDEYHSGGSNEA